MGTTEVSGVADLIAHPAFATVVRFVLPLLLVAVAYGIGRSIAASLNGRSQ